MYIELISKSSLWYGDKGVVMNIKASAKPAYSTLPLNPLLSDNDDKGDIEISISGLGEVSANSIYGNGCMGDTALWYVQRWLDSNGLMAEWQMETTKYLKALSRVKLPFAPRDVGRSYLSYCLRMGAEDTIITLGVRVYEEATYITVRLMEGPDWNEDDVGPSGEDNEDNDCIDIGDSVLQGTITTDTLKGVALRHLDKIWSKLSMPLVERGVAHD